MVRPIDHVEAKTRSDRVSRTLQTYSKPIRSFTTTLVRPCVVIPLTTGDVHAFVSAIGYRYVNLASSEETVLTL